MAPLTRLCLTGPECTGKSTLAERLARELRVPWVREYAREYAEARGNQLSAADVEPIARGQIAVMEAALAAPVAGLLSCSVAGLLGCSVTGSPGHPVTQSPGSPVTRSPGSSVTRSLGPSVTQNAERPQQPSNPATQQLVIYDTDLISTVVYARHYYASCPEWIEEEARRRRADLYLLMDTDVPWRPDAARDRGGDEREDLFDAFRAALDEFDTRWQIISGDWKTRFTLALQTLHRDPPI